MIDRTGTECGICHEGCYRQTSFQDEYHGVLHCTECKHEVPRYIIELESEKRDCTNCKHEDAYGYGGCYCCTRNPSPRTDRWEPKE